MSKIGSTVVKYLEGLKRTRYVVEADDLFNLFNNMGIIDDDITYEILEYFDTSNIDIHFKNQDDNHYKRFKDIERRYKTMKKVRFNREKVVKIIEKVDSIKPKIYDEEWLNEYRNDEEEIEETDPTPDNLNPSLMVLNDRIRDEIRGKILQELSEIPDEERLRHATEQLVQLNNLINNNNN
jgi:hypothetical protein